MTTKAEKEKLKDEAWEEYQRTCDQAFAEFNRIRDQALAKIKQAEEEYRRIHEGSHDARIPPRRNPRLCPVPVSSPLIYRPDGAMPESEKTIARGAIFM